VNPLPGGVTTGVGTPSFTWGNPTGVDTGANSLQFAGVGAFAPAFESPFEVCTVSYLSETRTLGTTPANVSLRLSLTFTQRALPAGAGDYLFSLITPPNLGVAPDADADIVKLSGSVPDTAFLIGPTVYRVKLVGFDNIVGDGFLTSNATEFRVREGLFATADLFATITTESPVIPVPAALPLLVSGPIGLGLLARRGRRAA